MPKLERKILKKYLVKLFLIVAFPIHVWSIYQIFNNVAWIADRTRPADALGYAGYALMYALIESFLVFLVTIPFFLLLTKNNTPQKSLALVGITYLVVAVLWIFHAIMTNHTSDQYFLDTFINQLADEHKWRKRYRYAAILLAIGLLGAPVLLAPYFTYKSDKAIAAINSLFERFELLTGLFLFFDLVGIVVVIVRNIAGAV